MTSVQSHEVVGKARKLFDIDDTFDYMLLVYLELPSYVIEKHTVLRQIRERCIVGGWETDSHLRNLARSARDYIRSEGIREISPQSYIVERTRDAALDEYRRRQWKGLHIPFMFQTFNKNMKDMLYVICKNPQDGLIRMHSYLTSEQIIYKMQCYVVCGVIEHAFDEGTLVRQIFDCETMLSYFDGSVSKDFLIQLMTQIPASLSLEFEAKGVLEPDSFVTFEVKNRSRAKGKDDFKISYHMETNIVATKEAHRIAMKTVLGSDFSMLERLRDKKVLASLTQSRIMSLTPLQKSLLFIDPAALPGAANGITTIFSRKSFEDPFPTHEKTLEFLMGTVTQETLHPHPLHADKKRALETLCNLSLIAPIINTPMQSYCKDLLDSVSFSVQVILFHLLKM